MIKFFVSGQVDSGKSTLIGYLLHHTMHLKMDSTSNEHTKYADLLDVDSSERARGITQSSSNSLFTFNNIEFEAIDTPGHLLYIRELINSISTNKGAIGCLLVSAVLNEFTSMFSNGTTKEDTILMRCCGVNHLIVVINKIDKKMAEHALVKNMFDPWVQTLGFKSITYVPLSGFTGINVFERTNVDEPCFIEALINVHSKIKRNHNTPKTWMKSHNRVVLQFHALEFDKIIVIGFKSVFHLVEHPTLNELEGEIVKLRDNNHKPIRFFRKKQQVMMVVLFDNSVELFVGQRLILRDSMNTIGFGYVMQPLTNN